MLCGDSGPMGAQDRASFPGCKAVTQGHAAGQPRWQLAGLQHTQALPSLEPQQGLCPTHVPPGSPLPPLAEGRLGRLRL